MPPNGRKSPVPILLVEDTPDDADLMVEALEEGPFRVAVTVVEDGEEAILYLRQQGGYANSPTPELILLDLHLPRMSGREVLAAIKQDPALRQIPVIIMTSSDNERVIQELYNLHANCCLTKPSDQEQFAQAVQRIEQFWMTVARRLPGF